MISLQQVCKSYRQKAVYDHLSLEIPANQITTIVGENGIGKSTLLKMIAGIERYQSGNILYDGESWSKKMQQQSIGYVPQHIALWDHMTVRDNIRFFKALLKRPISDTRIASYVEHLNMTSYIETPVQKLSGGTQRKANLLIGLLSAPRILILDEPTVGIDLKSRTDIQQLLQQLKNDMTIVMTTHLIDEIEQFTDNTILIGNDPFYDKLLSDANIPFSKI